MPRTRTLLLLFGDIAILFLSYLIAAYVLISRGWFVDLDFETFVMLENGIVRIGIVVFALILGMYFLGLYEQVRIKSRRVLLEDLMLVMGVTFLIQALLSYARAGLDISRWMMLFGSALAIVLLMIWRNAYSGILLRVLGRQRVLFFADAPLSRQLAAFITEHPERGYSVVGCVTDKPDIEFPYGPVFPADETAVDRIATLDPDRIVVSMSLKPDDAMSQHLQKCSMRGLRVENVGDLYEDIYHRVALETITMNQLVFSPAFRPKAWVVFSQAIYGRAIAVVGLFLAWPLMLITGILVKLDSEGPAILRQVRLGQGGVRFSFLKFRSMYVDADKMTGPVRAQENDPRITRVGKWIRLTRLDELPQFINVLRGEMTLVGPRPEMPELEAKLLKDIPLYPQRYRVKPGITGWAQINHEPEDSTANTVKKLEYDLFYIKNMSPGMDFITMFHTIKAVMMRMGAR